MYGIKLQQGSDPVFLSTSDKIFRVFLTFRGGQKCLLVTQNNWRILWQLVKGVVSVSAGLNRSSERFLFEVYRLVFDFSSWKADCVSSCILSCCCSG